MAIARAFVLLLLSFKVEIFARFSCGSFLLIYCVLLHQTINFHLEVRILSLIKVMAAGALLSGLGMVTTGVAGPVQQDVQEDQLSQGRNQPIMHVKELPFRIRAHNVDYVTKYKRNKETTYYENISWEKPRYAKKNAELSGNIMHRFPAEPLLQGSKSSRVDKRQTASIASVSTINKDVQPSFSNPVTDSTYTSHFGMRNGYHHNGVDIVSQSRNLDIRAAKTGRVVSSQLHTGGLGNLIIIDHGNGYESYYGHLSKRLVSEGDLVRAGDIIGTMGNTGNSTGVHLHFEIRKNNTPLNPTTFLNLTG